MILLSKIIVFRVQSLQKSLQNHVKNAFGKKVDQKSNFYSIRIDFGKLFRWIFEKNRDKFSIEFLVPNFMRQEARILQNFETAHRILVPRRHSHRPNSKAVTQIWWEGLCRVPWSPGGPEWSGRIVPQARGETPGPFSGG